MAGWYEDEDEDGENLKRQKAISSCIEDGEKYQDLRLEDRSKCKRRLP